MKINDKRKYGNDKNRKSMLESKKSLPCNIYNSKCIGIMANKVYDTSKDHRKDKANKVEEFTIDINSKDKNYSIGEKVCIESVSMDYDYIGIMDDFKEENSCDGLGVIYLDYDDEIIRMFPLEGNGNIFDYIDIKNNFKSKEEEKDYIVLFNNFNGNLSLEKSYVDSRGKVNINIFKMGLNFYVNNLSLKIKGTIGGKGFSATKNYRNFFSDNEGNYLEINPVKITTKDTLGLSNDKDRAFNGEELVGLNFNPVNMTLDLKVLEEITRTNLNLNINSDLYIDSIIPIGSYKGDGKLLANVRYGFVVDFNMYSLMKEEIAIFVRDND